MSDRPIYRTEPREDLETRVEVLNEIIVSVFAAAEGLDCDCRVCGALRRLVDELGGMPA